MKRWNVADAKARFSAVLHDAEKQPQLICNRDRPVAVVLSFSAYEKAAGRKPPSIKEMLRQLRQIQKTEKAEIDVPPRRDRPLSFPEKD
jgi:prevent-host-death family protein